MSLTSMIHDFPSISLNMRQLCDYDMIQNGGFAPLNGFMTEKNYHSTIDNMRLENGKLWSIPIVLHVSKEFIENNLIQSEKSLDDIISNGNYKLKHQYVGLKDVTELPLCLMKIESIFKMDLMKESKQVFNSTYTDENDNEQVDINHPYVAILNKYKNEGKIWCIGGTFEYAQPVTHIDFNEIRMSAKEARDSHKENENVVGFQTRNPMHRSHYELTMYAMKMAAKNDKSTKLFLNPVVGVTQECDVDYFTRVKCYKELMKVYKNKGINATLSLLPLSMRMAGPREAVWHALIRKNFGCTHFVVGRDHAGPSYKRVDGNSFYGPYDAQELLEKYAQEIGITPITSKFIVFSVENKKIDEKLEQYPEFKEGHSNNTDFMNLFREHEGEFNAIDQVNKETHQIFNISGTLQRELLRKNKPIPDWFTFPNIVSLLRQSFSNNQGIVYYFVGLSGSGKTTLAKNLINYLRERTFTKITYLDGDVVRKELSKGLGFSKEDRSTNVRRIGYVASEVAKHGGICVCANIAPYEDDRLYNKNLIESKGGKYIEIFVNTPVEVCESRDVKGLYKLARDGKIKLTGINDPFEVPKNPTVKVNSSKDLIIQINVIKDLVK